MDNEQQTETYFIFDLDPHIDPNFIEWLGSQGIIVKFNLNGTGGAIAQNNENMLLPVDPSYYSVNDLPSVTLSSVQMLPTTPDEWDEYFEQGKQTVAYSRRIIHSGNDNWGRSRPERPKCNNPNCLKAWKERCKEWDLQHQGDCV